MKIVNSTQPNNLFLLKHNKINPGNNTLSFCGKISFIAKPDDLIKNLETYSVNAQNRQMGIINYNCFVSLLQKGVMYVKSLFYKDKASQDINKIVQKYMLLHLELMIKPVLMLKHPNMLLNYLKLY